MTWRTHVLAAWSRLRSTYWFVPSLMTLAAVGLGLIVVSIDRGAATQAPWRGWVYGGGADGARALLSVVAGSTITVVSLTFSITVVALTVASQHFGPRLLSNFMRDTTAQIVLGTLIGTFAFCLVVLRTIRGEGEAFDQFVPHLSVTVAVAVALLSVAALIFYLHHVASSMQVSRIALNVTRDLEAAIDRLYPDAATGAEREVTPAPPVPAAGIRLHARLSGYVQAVDLDALVALARRHRTTIWLTTRPGDFVTAGTELAVVAPAPADLDACDDALRGAFVLGADRTSWQDAEFAVHQLVEVTLHALPPGINEPFTAVTCIDRLGQGLLRLLGRRMPSSVIADRDREVRVIAGPKPFADLLHAAFDPITLCAGPNHEIYRRLLETLASLAAHATRPPDRAAIGEQAESIRATARERISLERHREAIEALAARVGALTAVR